MATARCTKDELIAALQKLPDDCDYQLMHLDQWNWSGRKKSKKVDAPHVSLTATAIGESATGDLDDYKLECPPLIIARRMKKQTT